MQVFVTREITNPIHALAKAMALKPTQKQLGTTLSGFGQYHDNDCTVIWDRNRVWVLTPQQWGWHRKMPTVCGSLYLSFKLERWKVLKANSEMTSKLVDFPFAYQPEWNKIIPSGPAVIHQRKYEQSLRAKAKRAKKS